MDEKQLQALANETGQNLKTLKTSVSSDRLLKKLSGSRSQCRDDLTPSWV